MSNAERGEISITLNGKRWTLAPTFGAFCEIEDALGGITIMDLASRIAIERMISIKMIGVVLHAGIRAAEGNEAPRLDQVGEWMIEAGLESVQQPVIDFLAVALKFYSKEQEEISKEVGGAAESPAETKVSGEATPG